MIERDQQGSRRVKIAGVLQGLKTGVLVCCCIAIMLMGWCSFTIEEVSAAELRQRWQDSDKNSAVAWWYCGQEQGFRFFVEEWPDRRIGLKVEAAEVRINSNGSATIRVSEQLKANLSSSGNLYYVGSPTVDVRTTSSGDVEQIGE